MKIVSATTKDGLEYKGLFSEPNKSTETIVVHIHGMAGDFYTNNFYPYMHDSYPKSGVAFLAGENRGTHGIVQFNSVDGIRTAGNIFETFEETITDIEAWVQTAKDMGYTRIWLQSHSLGTSKTAYYMTHNPAPEIVGNIWLSPSDMIGLVHDQEGYKDHKILYPEAKKLIESNKESKILSKPLWGEYLLSAGTYLNFFEKTANTAIFNYGLPELGWSTVNNIKGAVLAITGTEDDGIVPVMEAHEAMQLLEKQLYNTSIVKTTVLNGAEHSFKGFEKNIVDEAVNFIINNTDL
jgi:hypothetical protein